MAADAFDLAGFCVGFVERDELIDRTEAQAGDAIIGLASSGLHANGYSLVRKLIDQGSIRLEDMADGGQSFGEALLTPTTAVHAGDPRPARHAARPRGFDRAASRTSPAAAWPATCRERSVTTSASVFETRSWPQPPIFDTIGRLAGIGGAEMRATFNCGIGFAVVLEEAAVQPSIELLGVARHRGAAHRRGPRAADELGRALRRGG